MTILIDINTIISIATIISLGVLLNLYSEKYLKQKLHLQ